MQNHFVYDFQRFPFPVYENYKFHNEPERGSVGYKSVAPRHCPVYVLLPTQVKRRLAWERRREFEYVLNDV